MVNVRGVSVGRQPPLYILSGEREVEVPVSQSLLQPVRSRPSGAAGKYWFGRFRHGR